MSFKVTPIPLAILVKNMHARDWKVKVVSCFQPSANLFTNPKSEDSEADGTWIDNVFDVWLDFHCPTEKDLRETCSRLAIEKAKKQHPDAKYHFVVNTYRPLKLKS